MQVNVNVKMKQVFIYKHEWGRVPRSQFNFKLLQSFKKYAPVSMLVEGGKGMTHGLSLDF